MFALLQIGGKGLELTERPVLNSLSHRLDIVSHLIYMDGNPDILKRVEVVHGFIPFDDKDILKNYFSAELREISLGQLGIK